MKRLFRVVCAVFAAAALSMGVTAAAVNDVVDMSNSTHGYVTVNYSSSARLRLVFSTTAARPYSMIARAARMLPSLSIRATASTP